MHKGKIFNRPKHDYYKQTRCTSTAQEEQSALPAGVINRHEDSSEDEDCYGEGKEMAKEAQELRAAAHWINQSGWDTASEGRAVSPTTGREIDLRLDWTDVKKKLKKGVEADLNAPPRRLDEEIVFSDYSLDKLDPTQRVFADRVLKWAADVVAVYKNTSASGRFLKSCLALVVGWLGGQREVHDVENCGTACSALVPAGKN